MLSMVNVLRETRNGDEWAWEKSTIHYTIDNQMKIKNFINKLGKGRITVHEVEDIYSDFLIYLYNKEDYDPTRVGANGTNVTLEGYVCYSIKKFVESYIYRKIKSINNEKVIVIKDDDLDILDIVGDPRIGEDYEEILYNDIELQVLLENIQYKRYMYGLDIFKILFIKLVTLDIDKEDAEAIFTALGVESKDLQKFYRRITKDPEVMELVRVLAIDKDAKRKLEKMVYGANTIKRTIESIKNRN